MRFPIEPLPATLWTIGHSTLPIESFVEHLTEHGIATLADVRRYPGSRRYPHFNPPALATALRAQNIEYLALPDLGGRRKPRADSPNVNWRNEAFRGYADYMQTADFARAMRQLTAVASTRRTAIMCAEALWWRCHRSLIADAFKAAGTQVWNIDSAGRVAEHPYTSAAQLVDGELTYGSAQDLFGQAG